MVAGGSVTSIDCHDIILWYSSHSKLSSGILKNSRAFFGVFIRTTLFYYLPSQFSDAWIFIREHGNENIFHFHDDQSMHFFAELE